MDDIKVKKFFSGYALDFDSIYGDGKKRSFISKLIDKFFRVAMFERYKKTINFITENKINSVLDVGCGSGVYMEVLSSKNIEVAGVDLSQNMIDLSKSRLDKNKLNYNELIVGSYLDTKFEKQYEVSILMGFFDYIENPYFTFEKLRKDTSKYILASFPKKGGLLAFQRKIRYNLRQCPLYLYSKKDIENFLRKLNLKNFKIIDNTREFFLVVEI